jgi:hypothetical protein
VLLVLQPVERLIDRRFSKGAQGTRPTDPEKNPRD